MTVAHIAQDEFGLWFLTIEEDGGRVWLHSHAGATVEDMEHEVEHVDVDEVRIERPRRQSPKDGAVDAYRKPTPKKVR